MSQVVQNPDDASQQNVAFDYVILCVKALPDVYNLADIIQSVVTKQHTCILVNTTNTLGVEKELEKRFPTNVVLSLVSGADLTQLGSSEFEHSGTTDLWVGPANVNSEIPEAIQQDMSEALAMTLTTGQVDCQVSNNIRQQQFERMIGSVSCCFLLLLQANMQQSNRFPSYERYLRDTKSRRIGTETWCTRNDRGHHTRASVISDNSQMYLSLRLRTHHDSSHDCDLRAKHHVSGLHIAETDGG